MLSGIGLFSTVYAKDEEEKPKTQVVILGSGWGCVGVLKGLQLRFWERKSNYEITVVSPRPYFLFTPLLPGCTTGSISFSSLLTPIREILNKYSYRTAYYQAECTGIDPVENTISCIGTGENATPFTLKYDQLIVSVGATNATFNTPGIEHAYFLKTMEDAHKIRVKLLSQLETANCPNLSDEERKKLLSFVIVGGGPTGCEFTGELHEFIQYDVAAHYPALSKHVSIHLIQSGNMILNTFDKKISAYATEKMKSLPGMDVRINNRVLEVTKDSVVVLDKDTKQQTVIPCGTCVWSTGIVPLPISREISKKLNQNSRNGIAVDPHLQAIGANNIYAIGDCSVVEEKRLKEKSAQLFFEADLDGDKTVDMNELKVWSRKTAQEYPQLLGILKNVKKSFREADVDNSGFLDEDEFRRLLENLDCSVRAFPTTAQVASQEGVYVGRLLKKKLNSSNPEALQAAPFVYHQVASFAKIGKIDAVADVNGVAKGGGIGAFLLWKGVYLGYQQTWSNVASVGFDWLKKFVFGRSANEF